MKTTALTLAIVAAIGLTTSAATAGGPSRPMAAHVAAQLVSHGAHPSGCCCSCCQPRYVAPPVVIRSYGYPSSMYRSYYAPSYHMRSYYMPSYRTYGHGYHGYHGSHHGGSGLSFSFGF